MATIGDDCYFFCTSTCSKGANCPFRHVEAAKTCRIICQHWQMGGCLRPSCRFRHSDFHIQINPTEIACYWEAQPNGCKKSNCPFKHSKPRPDQDEDITKAAANPSSQSENISAENGSNNSGPKFVRPVVEPVVIEPDSEASNSSPVKSLDKKKTDDQKGSVSEGEKERGKDLHKEESESASTDSVERKKSVKPKKPTKGALKKNTEKNPQKKKNAETKKGTIQKKKEKSSPKVVKKPKAPTKKAGVKERLGTARKEPEQSPEEENSGSESTDSDDSIENVKVLSMEEIFRQKALQSMMKKRAAEGKPMLPPSVTAVKRPSRSPSKPLSKNVIKLPKKEAPKPKKEELKQDTEEEEDDSDAETEDEESESEKEEEEEEDDESEESEEEETEDEEEDSTESSTSEYSESEEEIEAPRRVIIDIDDDEKLARRKKANRNNLQKRVLMKSDGRSRKREVIKEPAFQEPPLKKSRNIAINQPSDIRKRLGKPVSKTKKADIEEKNKKFATKRKLIVEDDRSPEVREQSDEDINLGGIKIKTLEEIRAEKARRLQDNNQLSLSPQRKQQVSGIEPFKRTIMLKDEVKESALSDPGPIATVEKKPKKRPWKRQKTAPQQQAEDDHRTVSTETPKSVGGDLQDDIAKEQYKANEEKEESSPESPTESLRRRALLKKVLSKGLIQENEEFKKSSSKKSKHKHKHKKKLKIERQLYVPPALKSSGGKSIPSDEESMAQSDEEKPQNSRAAVDNVSEKVIPQRVVAQRVGALWAAGLNAPSKGLGARNVSQKEVVKEAKPLEPVKATSVPMSKKTPSDDNLPTIKTFSQIMAEKRQKRLLLQQQAKTAHPSSESIPASIQSESNPRVPISPIVFNSGDASKQLTKSSISPIKASLKTPKNLFSEDTPSPSKLSGPVKEDFLRPEKSKKFFKKSVSKEVTLNLDLDSSVVNKHSHSLETSSKGETDLETDLESAALTSPSFPSLLSETEPISSTEKTQKRRFIEDEFSFFEDDVLDDGAILEDVEPIDDLLQDIDSLLA